MNMIGNLIEQIQNILDFNGVHTTHFKESTSLGRIGLAGFLLGVIGGFHFCLLVVCLCMDIFFPQLSSFSSSSSSFSLLYLIQWCSYVSSLCLFHFLEFLITAIRQPRSQLSYNTFVINHSKSYTFAALLSWIEYWMSHILFGKLKHNIYIYLLGLFIVILGQVIRSLAMWQCGEHFNHIIMEQRDSQHKLVKTGVYSILRHPSYFGWFYWSVGTQILLCNPICTIAYFYAAWSFFNSRIPVEEKLLYSFYSDEYFSYSQSTYIGIPFITWDLKQFKKNTTK